MDYRSRRAGAQEGARKPLLVVRFRAARLHADSRVHNLPGDAVDLHAPKENDDATADLPACHLFGRAGCGSMQKI